jgi:hypothetical protein
VRVAVKASLGVTVGSLVAGQIPDNESLVSASRQEHVWAGRQLVHYYAVILFCCPTYFSREVAREVTHPVWPSRVPLRTNCSAMMKQCCLKLLMGS